MKDPTKAEADQVRITYRVGDLRVDTGRRRVTREERALAVTGLTYDLLMVLLREAPNLVANDELLARVWPKSVVSPETLSQRVKLLRDSLGDDPRSPTYVEGVRGRGYRLIPTVERIAPASVEPVTPAPSMPDEKVSTVSGPNPGPDSPPLTAHPAPLQFWRRPGIRAALIVLGMIAVVVGTRQAVLQGRPFRKTSVEIVGIRPRAVAVLPFDNLSAEPGNQYIALGIAESVLNRLSSIHELIVIARSSSFSLGNSRPDPQELGRRLGVEYLVEGSVQRAGNKLRVNAQLVDAEHNRELWTLSFDRSLDDVFAVQDEIALQVAKKLEVSLNKGTTQYEKFGTEAYLAFLRGRALLESRKIPEMEECIAEFGRALQLAPSFAAAMTDLAYAKLQLASLRNDYQKNVSTLLPEINSLVNRAIELDPAAGSSYYLRAQVQLESERDRGHAEADFRRGFELAPNYALGVYNYGSFLFEEMRYEEALSLLDRASLLDPLAPSIHYLRGEILEVAYGRRDDAAASYRQALAVAPDFYPAYTRLAMVFFGEGKLAEAIQVAEKSIAIEPHVFWTRARLVWFYVHLGDLAAARDVQSGFAADNVAAQFNEALICYRGGHLEAAERIARRAVKDPDFEQGISLALATEAIVERALARRQPAVAREFIMAIPGLKIEQGSLAVVDDNWPIFLTLAALEQQSGNRSEATRLAQATLSYIQNSKSTGPVGLDHWTRAAALALLGRNDEAIEALETMARTGNHLRWWVTLESDPIFTGLRGLPSFQSFANDSRAWAADQQKLVQQMRQRQDIPVRAAAATANGC